MGLFSYLPPQTVLAFSPLRGSLLSPFRGLFFAFTPVFFRGLFFAFTPVLFRGFFFAFVPAFFRGFFFAFVPAFFRGFFFAFVPAFFRGLFFLFFVSYLSLWSGWKRNLTKRRHRAIEFVE